MLLLSGLNLRMPATLQIRLRFSVAKNNPMKSISLLGRSRGKVCLEEAYAPVDRQKGTHKLP